MGAHQAVSLHQLSSLRSDSDRGRNRWLIEDAESVVKRPTLGSKPKKSSALRTSFGPPEDGEDDVVFKPRKSNLSRVAAERSVERKVALQSDERPSYSKDYLQQLKSATPSSPGKSTGDDGDCISSEVSELERGTRELDIVSKFGAGALTKSSASAIPTDAEIREKKERRARLAKEQAADFVSLDPEDRDDDDHEFKDRRLALRPEEEKYPETRLVPDDEDVAEGFDDFTEDGKVTLGRNAEREAERRRRQEMRNLISQAEGSGSDASSDASEAERNAAYEAAQTRAGTYGERSTGSRRRLDDDRPKTPPRIAPVPELGAVLAKLKSALQSMKEAQLAKEMRLEDLRREKEELAEREVWIQKQLKDTGERYEKLRQEAGMAGTNGVASTTSEGKMFLDRGLESLGTSDARGATPVGGLNDGVDARS